MLLLLTVCLVAEPATCREDRVEMSFQSASPFVCLRNSQSALATWQAAHPLWHVERWRCASKENLPKDL